MPQSQSQSQFILALDQGTTSSRAILFDRQGQVFACAQQEFPQHFPQPGWVEHDALDIWTSQLACARKVLRDGGVDAAQIAAIGIANQRESTVVWDRTTGEPVARAIVWQDRRTAGACDRLRAEGHARLIQRSTGLELDAYFSATKLAWLLDNVPGARKRAERGELCFGTVDSWLAFQLCGRHVTDVSNASRTMLYNIHTMRWDPALLALFNIPEAMLPEVVRSAGEVGQAKEEWFGRAIPVSGIAGDQQAATFGQACYDKGMVKNTYGTGCFMLMHAGYMAPVSRNRLLATIGWKVDGRTDYLLEGSVFMGGATVQWLRDGLGIIKESKDVEPLAMSVTDSGGVMLVPAFVGLGAPHWDPYARGTIVGMTRGTTAAHIARRGGGNRLPERGAARRHAEGCRLPSHRGACRRRRRPQRLADAVPGRPARRAGGAPGRHGNHGARRGLPGRAGAGLLEFARRDCRAVARRTPLRAGHACGAPRRTDGALGQGCDACQGLG